MNKKLYIKTYGCQMNVYDSNRMVDLLETQGYDVVANMADASVIILNTCHIREKASEKMYSELGRIKKLQQNQLKAGKKKAKIIVAGCVGQAEGEEIFIREPAVDIIVGPQSYYNLPTMLKKLDVENHLIDLDFVEAAKFDILPEVSKSPTVSGLVSVQEGCDKFCAFCVVPYTRGAEFSRPMEQVYREVLNIVQQGAKEITLVGQNVSSYHGKDQSGKECSLADLIKYIAKIDKIQRIRYITSHPNDMTDQLLSLHATEEKLMPFLHLPIQSGSNKILKLMNRRYSREKYLEIIQQLRKLRPDIVISSDIIVGFPGEEDKDFEATLSIAKEAQFGQCYSFKYSPRPGTPAAVKEQIPEEIKQQRLSILQTQLMQQQLECNQKLVGKIVPVLFNRDGKYENQIIGKTPYMQSVYTKNEKSSNLYGKIANVKILSASASSLFGEVCSNNIL
ncbi:tRNA-i(6)A37 thiotransferase enzyme MiaB [Orientia chuto str. Dubai]|uniref:tRNA-2-methylthio-N(6)-dimethylallyladenosine synthase n=1 Tax=Orientia chuto str. Dubai TaxID=1359168 RepID=A0A0F3MNR9_9RICK|nr:tRNA (N6-isopentenyl adenosine(37)-C2)-methylthiotransferase MiaB [Candidatus Orientia mediorientalis]KJV57087.1 tRNA-i(6)A37 thiotransferase enzyme MiaB [Orientia chuto str. Dubai]